MTEGKSVESAQQTSAVRLSVIEKTLELVMAALSLVAALAWNDAIQSLFVQIFGPASSLAAKFLYASLVTVVVVAIVLRLRSLSDRFHHSSSAK